MLVSGGVKMYMDGSGGARTAWMYDDWNKNLNEIDKGNTGYPSTDPAVYRQIVTELHNAGVHVSTHAIGDRAIDWVVDTYDEALKAAPTRGLRHGLIHANTPTDRAIDAMARLQRDHDAAYPEASAEFMWWIGDNYAGNLGPQRNVRLKPFQTFVRKGVQWGGGSDYPVTPFAGAVRRVGLDRSPHPERNVWRDAVRNRTSPSMCGPPSGRTRRGRHGRCFSTIGSARSRPGRTPTSRCGIAIRTTIPADAQGHALRADAGSGDNRLQSALTLRVHSLRMIRRCCFPCCTVLGAFFLSCSVPALAQEHQHPQAHGQAGDHQRHPAPN